MSVAVLLLTSSCCKGCMGLKFSGVCCSFSRRRRLPSLSPPLEIDLGAVVGATRLVPTAGVPRVGSLFCGCCCCCSWSVGPSIVESPMLSSVAAVGVVEGLRFVRGSIGAAGIAVVPLTEVEIDSFCFFFDCCVSRVDFESAAAPEMGTMALGCCGRCEVVSFSRTDGGVGVLLIAGADFASINICCCCWHMSNVVIVVDSFC